MDQITAGESKMKDTESFVRKIIPAKVLHSVEIGCWLVSPAVHVLIPKGNPDEKPLTEKEGVGFSGQSSTVWLADNCPGGR